MRSLLLFVLSISLGLTVLIAGGAFAGEYDHELKDKKMTFSWKIDGDTLAVKLSAKTTGWVGIGFNPSVQMKDANYVLGYVKKGKARIIDEFGDKKTSHKSDKKLGGTVDAVLVGGTEEGGVTTVEFTLPLQSADKYDTSLEVNGDTTVLLAFGGGRDSFRSKHKYRKTYTVNLGSGIFTKVK